MASERTVWLRYTLTDPTDKRRHVFTDYGTTPARHAEKQRGFKASGRLVAVKAL